MHLYQHVRLHVRRITACMYICLHDYVSLDPCMYIEMHAHIQIHTHIHIQIHIHIHIPRHIHICKRMHIHIRIHIHIHIRIRICIHIYTHVYTYFCIHIYIERERERERCEHLVWRKVWAELRFTGLCPAYGSKAVHLRSEAMNMAFCKSGDCLWVPLSQEPYYLLFEVVHVGAPDFWKLPNMGSQKH